MKKIPTYTKPFLITIMMGSLFMTSISAQQELPFVLDVPYVPTPNKVVKAMLNLAEVGKDDILYDLGSGDGRIPISASKKFGIKAVGIELNPEHVQIAKNNAENAAVDDRVEIIEADIFKTDFSEATVLTLYLFPEINERLKPKIMQMKPGTRIVSHKYDMGDWEPEKTEIIISDRGTAHTIYLWKVPANPYNK